MRAAHAVIVGEGRLRPETLGKIAGEIAVRARQAGVPSHAIVGQTRRPLRRAHPRPPGDRGGGDGRRIEDAAQTSARASSRARCRPTRSTSTASRTPPRSASAISAVMPRPPSAARSGSPARARSPARAARRLRARLDALGDARELQRRRQLDDRPGQRAALVVAGIEAVDERLGHLQDVDREAAQVAQRRVARPEVVDGQPHAERLQRGQPLDRRLGVVHQHGLGDLQHQRRRRQPGVAPARPRRRSTMSGSSSWRPHRFTDMIARLGRRELRQPRGRLTARGAQDLAPELDDRPFSSASGMNCGGGTRPRRGCVQRTSASTPASVSPVQRDDRLVVDARARRARSRAAARPRAPGARAPRPASTPRRRA